MSPMQVRLSLTLSKLRLTCISGTVLYNTKQENILSTCLNHGILATLSLIILQNKWKRNFGVNEYEIIISLNPSRVSHYSTLKLCDSKFFSPAFLVWNLKVLGHSGICHCFLDWQALSPSSNRPNT